MKKFSFRQPMSFNNKISQRLRLRSEIKKQALACEEADANHLERIQGDLDDEMSRSEWLADIEVAITPDTPDPLTDGDD